MPHPIYMDVHVPAAVTFQLRRRGFDVLTSQEDGTAEIDDVQLLQRATALGRVLFSQDQDLLAIAANWQRQSVEFHTVIFAQQRGSETGEILEGLELFLKAAEDSDLRNRVFYIPLR